MKKFTKPRFFPVFYLIIAVFATLAITSCLEEGTNEPSIEQGMSGYTYYKIVNGQKVRVGSTPPETTSPPPAIIKTPPPVSPKPNPGQINPPPPATDNGRPGETQRTFTWNYKGQNFTMTISLKNSLDYKFPGYAPEEEYYRKFLITQANDNSIKEVIKKLKSLVQYQGLSDDQFVDFLAVFVQQGIPYSQTATDVPKFPYQTLMDGTGDCDDKSILAYKLLEELGYGVELISMPSHMAIGISCPTALSFNNSDFAYLEVAGPRILSPGQIPYERNGQTFSFIAPHKGTKIYHSPSKINA